jgi:hypothetical protein
VALQVLVIDLRAAAPDAPAVAVSDEEGRLGVLEERVRTAQARLHLQIERPHILRIVAVDVVNDTEKILKFATL